MTKLIFAVLLCVMVATGCDNARDIINLAKVQGIVGKDGYCFINEDLRPIAPAAIECTMHDGIIHIINRVNEQTAECHLGLKNINFEDDCPDSCLNGIIYCRHDPEWGAVIYQGNQYRWLIKQPKKFSLRNGP